MDKKNLFSKLRVLNFQPRIKTSNRHFGTARSTIKGNGMSFSEVREYHFGDEVRTIDWNVTARYNVPHVKIFEEEKEQHFLVILDASSSNLFSKNALSKWEKQIEVAAMVAFTAWKKNNYFGILIFSESIELYIPPLKGRQHFFSVIETLVKYKPSISKTRLDIPMQWLCEEKLSRSTVFFVSDFLSNLDFLAQIQRVVLKHRLFFTCVRHEEEETLPDVGWVQFDNLESEKKTWVNTSSRETKAFYQDFFTNQDMQLEQISKKNGVQLRKIFTNAATFKTLNSYYK